MMFKILKMKLKMLLISFICKESEIKKKKNNQVVYLHKNLQAMRVKLKIKFNHLLKWKLRLLVQLKVTIQLRQMLRNFLSLKLLKLEILLLNVLKVKLSKSKLLSRKLLPLICLKFL